MRSDAVATAAAAAAASVATGASSAVPKPVSFNASEWLGVDGNWSTYAFLVGNNNPVNVLFSTSLSEFWVVGPDGCPDVINDPQCITNRGGIFYPSDSKHWSGLGTWQLGLPDLGTGESGQYGFDMISSTSPITNTAFSMPNVLTSAISSTDYYLGYFGAGIRSGSFGDVVASPPLRQAVSSYGWIPSYSYGYTAGACYRNIVGSATLGGYDAARFINHDITFSMNQGEGIPRLRVRGIELSAKNGSLPAGWPSATRLLMTYDGAFTATIDTSTPYMWLPPSICDSFAKTLNMTYSDTFGLYTLTNEQYLHYLAAIDTLSFTFSLSSTDNNDNFGYPLQAPGVVNITIPLRSFVSLLQYPFMNGTVRQTDSAIPYFTLRRAANQTFIIGNAFLQESYLITKYDSSTFSIYQAQFPSDPIGGAQLQAIDQSPDSPFPPPVNPNAGKGLSTGALVGIIVGVVTSCLVLLSALFCYKHHRRQQGEKVGDKLDEGKDTSSTLTPDSSRRNPVTPRLFARITGRRQSPPRMDAVAVSTATEAGTLEAPDCQIYELPAPVPLVELDAAGDGDDGSIIGDPDLGTDSTRNLTAYEIARMKLDRQLQGPVPEYTPPADGPYVPHEKMRLTDFESLGPTVQDTCADQQTLPISPTPSRCPEPMNNNAYYAYEPSPVSPRTEWSSADIPSPVTISTLPRSISSGRTSRVQSIGSRSLSTNSNAVSSTADDGIPPVPAAFQKTPIDQSRVVCLGPLPENVRLPGQADATTRRRTATGDGVSASSCVVAPDSRVSVVSLGSNFTQEEEERAAEETSQQGGSLSSRLTNQAAAAYLATEHPPLPATQPGGGWELDTRSLQPQCPASTISSENSCIDPWRDLVHVPQVADKRYSWEDVQSPQSRGR